ncbi:hypothetical protein O7635_24605 [Asanoa sp. WMMD1127]|uniref:hypothetical protein n=1 Tax=Asanoa sp. WMMD1127 TaxID=3016107 RepID=UPI00241662AC|nr:hypothetical protein [Asanoa sp. WMMD1127]MDG4825042.1 hypothetical protein [Asanoa sp. WMMD1127]
MNRHRDILDQLARARPNRLDRSPRPSGHTVDPAGADVAIARPVDRPRRLRRLSVLLPGAGAASAAAVAVLFAVAADTPAAYGVASDSAGTVTVTVNRIDDPAQANRALRDIDDRVIVMRPSAEADCPPADRGKSAPIRIASLSEVWHKQQRAKRFEDSGVALIYPDTIAPGTVLVLVPSGDPANPVLVRREYVAPGPKCVIDPFIGLRTR